MKQFAYPSLSEFDEAGQDWYRCLEKNGELHNGPFIGSTELRSPFLDSCVQWPSACT